MMIDYKIIQDNLNNNTTLDSFMVKPELIQKFFPKNERQGNSFNAVKSQTQRIIHDKSVNDEGIYLVGFCGQFRTSRR